MQKPDFERARDYVFERLSRELPPQLSYHSLAHTRDDVLPAIERLAKIEGITDEESLLLLRTAAIYHDIGFLETYTGHEEAGCRIAAETLPEFGYNDWQIEQVCRLIQATILPQSPDSHLAELMSDADLDVLGREDFFIRSMDLLHELTWRGNDQPVLSWYKAQIQFLRNHHYFSHAALKLRQPGKEKNIQKMLDLIEAISGEKS